MKSDTINSLNQIWSNVVNDFKSNNYIDDVSFSNFFSSTSIDSIKNNKIIVSCPNKLSSNILSSVYKDNILDSVLRVTGTNYDIIFISSEDLKKDKKGTILNDLISTNDYFSKCKLNPNYTFDNFVQGICNEEAKKAAFFVATTPGKVFNPLYIQGNSGLGKTHLLNAIGNYIKSNHPELSVLYTSSTSFMEEYVNFARGNNTDLDLPSFIKKYDCLLIDDIQQLSDKTKTLDFFFEIYQSFYNAHKQIVITSDRYQNSLNGIPDRLITRFLSGLTVSINPPDTKTSKEILKLKFKTYEETGLTIDDDVLDLIAENFQDSIRSLEGILLRLSFYCSLTATSHIDLNLAYSALSGMLKNNNKNNTLNENKIILAVADFYHISQSQITGKTKSATIVNARQIAIYLIRTLLDTPYKQIGSLFSNRDHSTIMHSCSKVEKMYTSDPQMKEVIDGFKSNLKV